jgi:phosphatidate cytidylyltransferase
MLRYRPLSATLLPDCRLPILVSSSSTRGKPAARNTSFEPTAPSPIPYAVLKYRLITGPLLIAFLLGVVVFDDWLEGVALSGFWQNFFMGREHPPAGIALFVLALLVMPLAAMEIATIVEAQGILVRRWLMALAAVTGLTLSFCVPAEKAAISAVAIVATGMIVMFVLALLTFSRHKNVQGVVAAAGAVVFVMVYLGLMLGFLLALRREHSAWWIVGIILTTKSCDIGAYFTGISIGRHKMIPWLSPGKTWEGTAGGVVTSVIVGIGMAALSHLLPEETDHVPLWLGAICGALFAVVGQFGDLTMSLFKRGAGIKDSSQILPGMGGVMDVLDSPLMVAPVAYWVLILAM